MNGRNVNLIFASIVHVASRNIHLKNPMATRYAHRCVYMQNTWQSTHPRRDDGPSSRKGKFIFSHASRVTRRYLAGRRTNDAFRQRTYADDAGDLIIHKYLLFHNTNHHVKYSFLLFLFLFFFPGIWRPRCAAKRAIARTQWSCSSSG